MFQMQKIHLANKPDLFLKVAEVIKLTSLGEAD